MPLDFLSRLAAADRERLEAIGRSQPLGPREHLVRRGEVGGDIFRVESGHVEVVDPRSRPEVVLDVLGPGEVVGELGFIDGTPRSADVVAGPGCTVTRWPKEELEQLIQRDPTFAARFWKALAEQVSARLREVTAEAVTGALRGSRAAALEGPAPGTARELAASVRDRLSALDRKLRRDPDDPEAREGVAGVLDQLLAGLDGLSDEIRERPALARAARVVAREVHPYLLQSTTAELCLSRPEGYVGGARLLTHIHGDQPRGDGPMGLAVDGWLLGQPRSLGIRHRHFRAAEVLERLLSTHLGPIRVLLVNCSHGPLLNRIRPLLAGREGELGVVEATRDDLVRLDPVLGTLGRRMRVRLIQYPVGSSPAAGPLRHLADRDFVVADALLDYLPARAATICLRQLGATLHPQGQLLATALATARDAPLWQGVLDWPVVGRPPRSVATILHAAGFGCVSVEPGAGAGLLATASSEHGPS